MKRRGTAYLDDISIGLIEITTDAVEVVPFLQREVFNIGVAINPSQTVTLPPKGHEPTPELIALLEGIGVRISERGGVKVVEVPVGTDEYLRESTLEIVHNGGADKFARMLPRVPNKQSVNLIATGSMVQHTAKQNEWWTQKCPCLHAEGRRQRDVDAGETA